MSKERIQQLLKSRFGRCLLQGLVFLESSVLFIPVDVVVATLVVHARRAWWRVVLFSAVMSVLGGGVGYGIGVMLGEDSLHWIERFYGGVDHLADGSVDLALPESLHTLLGGSHFFEVYQRWAVGIVALFALTFLPYRLAAVLSGIAGASLWLFLFGSLLGRSIRFFVVGYAAYRVMILEKSPFVTLKHWCIFVSIGMVLIILLWLILGLV